MKITLLGYGTVARGVAALIEQNADLIYARTGCRLQIAAVYTRSHKADCPYTQVHSLDEALAIPADVVCELMGGTTTAYEAITAALAAGRRVVTANKALLAERRYEFESAGAKLGYEAAVAGGVPIIRVLKSSLVGCKIRKIVGILNGTSNFILTKMSREGCDFATALADAQRLGYAEADPTLDIEGGDAAHKILILASLAFGCQAQISEVLMQGLSSLSAEDFAYAAELGYAIKPLASATHTNGAIELRVHPAMICTSSILASVNENKNAVLIDDNALGTSLYYGAGAGSLETASAVLADILEPESHRAMMGFLHSPNLSAAPISELSSKFYLRLKVDDRIGVLADITAALAGCEISVDSIAQKQSAGDFRTVFITTHKATERQLNQLQALLKDATFIHENINIIRIM